MIWNCHTTTWGCQMPDFLLHVKEKCKKEKKNFSCLSHCLSTYLLLAAEYNLCLCGTGTQPLLTQPQCFEWSCVRRL